MSEFEDFVTITPKTITLPTYEIGKADSFPHFLEKRIYQGASGAVYPYRVVEHIQDDLIEKEYTAIYLENGYIKIMVLAAGIVRQKYYGIGKILAPILQAVKISQIILFLFLIKNLMRITKMISFVLNR